MSFNEKLKNYQIRKADMSTVLPIEVTKSKFHGAICCGEGRNFVFKASIGLLMNSEKVLMLFSERKGRILQLERLVKDKFMVLFTSSIELIQLDADKEISNNLAVKNSEQFTKFEILQKVIVEESQKIQCQLFILSSGKIFQYSLLTEVEDKKPRYTFFSTRELLLTPDPITSFSLLTPSHLIFTTSSHLQGACFSLASNLNPNTFAAVSIPACSSLLVGSQSIFTVHESTVLKHRLLRDWQVSIEAVRIGQVSDGIELMARWLNGEETRLIASKQTDVDGITGEKKSKLVAKIMDECCRVVKTWRDFDQTEEGRCKLRDVVKNMLYLLYSSETLGSCFRTLVDLYKELNQESVVFQELFIAVEESTIHSLPDSVLVSMTEYLVAKSESINDTDRIDTVLLGLDLTANDRDLLSSLFYEQALYACFLKVLLSQKQPDYFTGLSLLTSRMMRAGLGGDSKECYLVMSILYSAYNLQNREVKFSWFNDLTPTPILEKWLLSNEILECLFKAMPFQVVILCIKIYGQSSHHLRNQLETQLKQFSKSKDIADYSIDEKATSLEAAYGYFLMACHLYYDLGATRKQCISYLQLIATSNLIKVSVYDELAINLIEKHLTSWNYAQLTTISEITDKNDCFMSPNLAKVKMSKPLSMARASVESVCKLAVVVRRSCTANLDSFLCSVAASLNELISKDDAGIPSMHEKVSLLLEQVFIHKETAILAADNIDGHIMIEVMEQLSGVFRSDREFSKRLFSLYCKHQKEKALKYCKLHLLPLDDCIEIAKQHDCKEAEIYLLFRNGQFEKCIENLACYCEKHPELMENSSDQDISAISDSFVTILDALLSEKTLKNQEFILLMVARRLIPLYEILPKYLENLLFPAILEFDSPQINQYLMSACPETFLYWSKLHTGMFETTDEMCAKDYRVLSLGRHVLTKQGRRYDSCTEMHDLDYLAMVQQCQPPTPAQRISYFDVTLGTFSQHIDHLYY